MKYNYIEMATIAVVNSFKNEFKNFAYVSNIERFQEFPVFIQNSGDSTYMTVNSDRLEVKEVSDKVTLPALILAFRGVSINEENKTNEVSDAKFTLEMNGFSQDYTGEMSTHELSLKMDGKLLCTDIFQYMAFVEYLLNGVYKNKPFLFNYMGKVQQGSWTLDTTDHDVEYDETGLFGTESISSHEESLNFSVTLQYPSFNLNDSLTAYVDSNGDGNFEGGVGVPDGAIPSGNVIKSVIHYVDESGIPNAISKDITGGEFPDEKQKKID